MNIFILINILLLFYLDIVTENRIGQFDSPILIGKYIIQIIIFLNLLFTV